MGATMYKNYKLPSLYTINCESVNGIHEFCGTFRFLSNFWPLTNGLTTEHYYQAAKCAYPAEKVLIMQASSPGYAKRLGRTVKLRSDWDTIKVDVMRTLLEVKFQKGCQLAEALLATGVAQIEEGNTWGDTFWGLCNGVGQNILGKLLMEVRNNLACSEVMHSLKIAFYNEY
jgi:ribA/ribD-fused uncharacterized protein